MFKNLAIKWKLVSLVSIVLLGTFIVGWTGHTGVVGVGNAMNEVSLVRLPSTQGLLTLSEAQTAIKSANLTTLFYENRIGATEEFKAVLDLRKKAWANAEAGWKRYETLPQTPDETVMWKQFVNEWEGWKQADSALASTIEAMSRNTDEYTQRELFAQFFRQYETFDRLFGQSEDTLLKLVKLNEEVAAESVAAGNEAISTADLLMLAAAIAALVLSMIGSVLVIASITRPLARAVDVARTVASGDLTSEIHVQTSEETGQLLQALKNMNDSLVHIVSDVRNSTDAIATASGQIASGNLDLSSRTEEQASSLEETASSMEELTSTVKQNADNALQANQLAVSASEVASRGGDVVAQVVHTMDDINASSHKIVDIISVIDGIAFQTNILALNAAVEAARAGEQGRGFAVVASEVRNLAQRSAAAAKEIKQLIDSSVEKVGTGARLVNEAGTTMQEIVASVRRVTDIMGEITAASREQSSGIEQINVAVSQMDEVTQQNAALVEEAAAASASLQDQATKLSELVSVFKLVERQPPTLPAPAMRADLPSHIVPRSATRSVQAPPQRRTASAAKGMDSEDWSEF